MGWESYVLWAGLVREDPQLHLHQEDSVMVGEVLILILVIAGCIFPQCEEK